MLHQVRDENNKYRSFLEPFITSLKLRFYVKESYPSSIDFVSLTARISSDSAAVKLERKKALLQAASKRWLSRQQWDKQQMFNEITFIRLQNSILACACDKIKEIQTGNKLHLLTAAADVLSILQHELN